MKKRNPLIGIGAIFYLILSIIDRFIFKVPNYIYIPIAIIGIILIMVGLFKERKNIDI